MTFNEFLIKDIAVISSGKRPPKISKTKTNECPVPVIGGGGPSGFTSEVLAKKGALITGRVGTLGKLHVAPQDCWPSDNALVLRPLPDKVDKDFFRYALSLIISSAFDLNRGAANPLLTQTDLGALLIKIPAFAEQRAIASILIAIDDKIENNNRIAATLEEMARALYRSWFVDFDPVHAKAAGEQPAHMDEATAALFPDRFGDDGLPEGWETIAASKIVSITKGKSYKSKELIPSNTALVTLKSFARGGGYRMDGLKPYTGSFKPEQIVEPGEIILSMTDVTQSAEVIGRATLARSSPKFTRLVASLDVGIIRSRNEKIPSTEYLHQVFSSDEFVNHCNSRTTGTTVLHLSKEAAYSFKFALPEEPVLEAFQNLLSGVRRRVFLLEKENNTLANTRDALLPRLMSGEIRVGEAHEQVKELT